MGEQGQMNRKRHRKRGERGEAGATRDGAGDGGREAGVGVGAGSRATTITIMPRLDPCLTDVLTLSSVAALSIFTSGRSRPPGPGPMSDTTPLQSTVLFLFPPEWGTSGLMRDEPWLLPL